MDKYSSIGFGDLIKREAEDKILLPNFQRDFVWNEEQQKKLLASFIIDIPIGSVLLVEGEGKEYSTRKLCFEEPYSQQEEKDCLYLLDGQQRISTLKNVFVDQHSSLKEWDKNLSNGKLYRSLKNRWFINLKPSENKELNLFGFENLMFEESKLFESKPDDITPYIKYHKIFKGREFQSKWYGPGYHDVTLNITDESKRNQIKNIIAEKAAENYLVPLYTLSEKKDRNPLHRLVLEKLGQKRVDEFKSKAADNNEILRDFFGSESDIDELISNPLLNEERIKDLWNTLKNRWVLEFESFLNSLFERQIARIRLSKDEINRAIFVFEELNRGGTDLSPFDLLVARYAISASKEDKGLKHNIIDIISKNHKVKAPFSKHLRGRIWDGSFLNILNDKNPPVLAFKNLFLNQLGIISKVEGDIKNYNELNSSYMKEQHVLNLQSETIIKYYELASRSLLRALLFLQANCGVYDINKIGYKLTVIPISFLFVDDKIWKDEKAHKKILYWYWTALFSGTYREAQQPRTIRDLTKLTEWVKYDSENPFKKAKELIFKDKNYSDIDTLLMKTEDGVKGNLENAILQYTLSRRPNDLIKKELFVDNKVPRLDSFDIGDPNMEYHCHDKYEDKPAVHHIFPLGMFTRLGQNSSDLRYGHNVLNSPLNKTLISDTANKKLSDNDPNQYFSELDELSCTDHFFNMSDIKDFFEEYDSGKKLENLIPILDKIFKERFENLRNRLLNDLRDYEESF